MHPKAPRVAVSSYGRLYRLKASRGHRAFTYFKLGARPGGRKMAFLDGKNRFVARLVAEVFIPNPSQNPIVCHKDGNQTNDRADNLYWGTFKQNAADMLRHGTDTRGSKNARARLSEDDVRGIRGSLGQGRSMAEVARAYGVAKQTVALIAWRKTWAHVA